MENELLILKVFHPQKTGIGEFIYRIEQPSFEIGKIPRVRVILASINSPFFKEICLQADVVIWHMVSDQDVLWIFEERKRRGLPNVFEISDNFIAFQPRDPMKCYFDDPVNLATTFQYISLSDAVQVTSDELADIFGFLNNHFIVFENQLQSVGDFQKLNARDVTIGWAGSLSHLDDLKWIAPVVSIICRTYPNVRFSYMGTKEGFDYFIDIPDGQKSYTSTGSLYDYYSFLDRIDIGLAPLLDTGYNRCRSDIKFVEYASRGVVSVLSATSPYEKNAKDGVTALLFRDETELFEVLKSLILDPGFRMEIAKNAYEYARDNRQEAFHASEKIDFYRGLCGRKIERDIPTDAIERIGVNSQTYKLKETKAENLAFQGMNQYSKGNVSNEWGLYRKAIEVMPDYYIPYFWLGDSMFRHGKAEAVYYLENASRVYPVCLRPKLLLGLACLGKDKNAACRQFKEALKVSPLYAPAWDALGRISEEAGDYGKAFEYFNLSVKANPFYSLATLGIGRTYLALGKVDEALQTLSVANDILPDHIESRLELARLYLRSGGFREAVRQCIRILTEDPENSLAQDLLETIPS